jgi:hypothetical protein
MCLSLLSVFPVPETQSVISIMSKSFLNPVFVLSLRSSSVLIFEIISSGKEDEVRTRSKHDEIVDLMTKETCKEDKTPASKGLVVKPIVSK